MLLVAVRFCIGWQFLYEGLWKHNTLTTATPWTAAGYLKNAKGPFREHYRNLTGDPDDLDWLDADIVAPRWDDWQARFLAHHPDLSDVQKRQLDEMLNGREDYRAVLDELPEGVKIDGSLGDVIHFDAGRKRLIVDGTRHLLPRERDRLLKKVSVEENPTPEQRDANEVAKVYQDAVRIVYKRSSRGVSFKERLTASLKGNPERAGQVIKDTKTGELIEERLGKIELYKKQLVRYEQNLAAVEQAFQQAHLQQQKSELLLLRSELVSPVKALEQEFKTAATKLLETNQLARGPVPEPWTPIHRIDQMTIWGLIVLGVLLIAGLFSRLAALGGACLLLSFYLAMPPWPGVAGFQELPGPEHSFIVDKNLIEVFALLALAVLPTGRWFGVDALFGRRGAARRATGAATGGKSQTKSTVGNKQGQVSEPAGTPAGG
jgi:uncharacterized membrane protein YphA (DoxX/SURF4 family)